MVVMEYQMRIDVTWQFIEQPFNLFTVGLRLAYVYQVYIRAGKQFHNTLRLALKEEWACDYHIHIALPIKSNDASQSFHTGSRPSSRRRWFIVWAVRSSLTVNCSRACG